MDPPIELKQPKSPYFVHIYLKCEFFVRQVRSMATGVPLQPRYCREEASILKKDNVFKQWAPTIPNLLIHFSLRHTSKLSRILWCMESLKARASCPSHNVVFLTIVVYDINLMNYNDIKGKITSTKGYKVFYEELYECLKF